MKEIKQLAQKISKRGCDFPGCEKPHNAKGFCRGHYIQLARGKLLTRIGPKHPFCSFPACGREHKTRGLCSTHYYQLWKGHALYPIYSKRNKVGTGHNPELNRLRVQRSSRRKEERKANAKGFCTPEQLEARLEYYGYQCAYCPRPYEHIDHVIPLSKGGTAWPANLVPACASCNHRKSNRSIWEWLAILEMEVA